MPQKNNKHQNNFQAIPLQSLKIIINELQLVLNIYYDIENKIRSYPIQMCRAVGITSSEYRKKFPTQCNCISYKYLYELIKFYEKSIKLTSFIAQFNTSDDFFEFIIPYLILCGDLKEPEDCYIIDMSSEFDVRYNMLDYDRLLSFSEKTGIYLGKIDFLKLLCVYLIIEDFDNNVFQGLLFLLGGSIKPNSDVLSFFEKDCEDNFINNNYLYVCGTTKIGKALYRCVHCFTEYNLGLSEMSSKGIINTIHEKIKSQSTFYNRLFTYDIGQKK